MNLTIKAGLLVLCSTLSLNLYAVDDAVVNSGAQEYDRKQCIHEAIQTCINSTCLNSDQIDCQDNCSKLAHDKCQQQINE
ncbi:MAG: hypothetical protein ACHP6H_03050 [Legionellales bacterium]